MSAFAVRHVYLDPHHITHRIVFNPNYGGEACSVPGTCVIKIVERKMKPGFFKALEENIERDGFRNPIVVYQVDRMKLLSFGGSRLRVAKRRNEHLPCILIDYDGDFSGAPLVTPDNFGEFFTDVPKIFEFTRRGVVTHYSLERSRRDTYDSAGMEWTQCLEDDSFLEEEFPWL